MDVAARWDDAYPRGRYVDEPPVAFVNDILEAVRMYQPPRPGLYVGCGNGRNFVPLLAGGLDLVGLDVSAAALEQLRARVPGARLVHGDLTAVGGPFGEGLTVRYEAGPKRGLLVHFFAGAELERLTAHLAPVLPLRLDRTDRDDGTHWDQWEGIWQCA